MHTNYDLLMSIISGKEILYNKVRIVSIEKINIIGIYLITILQHRKAISEIRVTQH